MARFVLVYADLHRIKEFAVLVRQAHLIVLLAGVENVPFYTIFLLGKALHYFEPVWAGREFKGFCL